MEDKELKILYLDLDIPYILKETNIPTGGAATEWLSWIEGIKQTGVKFGLLTWMGAKDFINKDVGFDIIESFNIKKGIPILRLLYYRFPKLLMAVKKYNPDIIIQMGAGSFTFMGAIVSKILGKTFVYRVASDKDVDERIKKKLNMKDQILYKLALRNTQIFLSQNEFQYKMIKEKFPDKKNIILNSPYYVNSNLLSIDQQRSYIAWMGGNFRYEKNLASLLPLAKTLPYINFKISGKPTSVIDKASFDALEELKSLKNIEFIGYIKRSEILLFLSKAIVLLNTSYLEGFPMTFLEAWSTGTPVISTKNVNPSEIITKYNLGIVVKSYSELPNAINKIMNYNSNEDILLRLRCSEYVKMYHDPKILAGKLIHFLRESLDSQTQNN